MTLVDAVDLVLYAFENGESGDIFVQKAPAASIGLLATALKEMLGKPNNETKIIGTRHGEKLYESLLSREEMIGAIDEDKYFRIKSDNRGLNYEKYFNEGLKNLTEINEYNSHNTEQLNISEMKALLEKIGPLETLHDRIKL